MGKGPNDEGDFSPRAMAQMLNAAKTNCRGVLRAVPQRAQFLQQHQQVRQLMQQAYPWVDDPGDERQALYGQISAQFPELKAKSASAEYWIASAVRGHLETQKELKAKQGRPVTRPAAMKPRATTPSTGSNGTAPPGASARQTAIKQASDRVAKERSSDAFGKFLEATGYGLGRG